VRQAILHEIAARENPVDDGQTGRRPITHRERDRPIQLDDGRGTGQ
jgi:hypothetical protein